MMQEPGAKGNATVLKGTYARSEIHESWESVYRHNPLQDTFNNLMMDRIMACLDLPPHALFLDAGCGIGDHSLRIARKGYRCVGVDLSQYILQRAERKVSECGLSSEVTFSCQGLEDLSFKDATFDAVHCRGVLMHIPAWKNALAQLCRVLKPGGQMVIVESNHTSLEAMIVLLIRQLTARKSQLIRTPEGMEFWSEKDGNPFVARIANMKAVIECLKTYNVSTTMRISTEFWDINRFPSGIIRDTAIRFNRLWFSLRLPPFLSVGNAIIGQKLDKT